MSKEKAEIVKEMSVLVQNAYDALHAAEAFATEHKIGFRFEPSYGMGGFFDGDLDDDDVDTDTDESGPRWYASSQSC